MSTIMPTDAIAYSSAHLGAGVGPIYLDNVDCEGSESNLTNCSYSSFFSCYNGHLEDAGVRCQGRHLHITVLHAELEDHQWRSQVTNDAWALHAKRANSEVKRA